MREILPGVHHWTTLHPEIKAPVSSYLVEPAGIVIDPRVPDEGIEALEDRGVQQVVLTSGLHRRHSEQVAERLGCPVVMPRAARERLGEGFAAQLFADGDEVAPGVTAIEIGGLCPDESALHLAVDGGAIVLADALIRYGETLSFVPDVLMGDDPETVKAALRDALRGLLTRDFDHLLVAHGEPLVGGGKAALRTFLEGATPPAG
jgi:hypothetical protein